MFTVLSVVAWTFPSTGVSVIAGPSATSIVVSYAELIPLISFAVMLTLFFPEFNIIFSLTLVLLFVIISFSLSSLIVYLTLDISLSCVTTILIEFALSLSIVMLGFVLLLTNKSLFDLLIIFL